jgi:hypothetical protein
MLKIFLIRASLLLMLPVAVASAQAHANAVNQNPQSAIDRTRSIVAQIVKESYPELKNADIQVQAFNSESDYFRTGFSFGRFVFARKMRYIIKVNPRVFESNAPEESVRAILAHELGHVFDFHRKKRIRLLGLIRLSSKGYTAEFERWTDLQAILRGYGEGLKAYRKWLYANVPAKKLAEKQRNYFSPEEIDAIELKRKQYPELMPYWLKRVPRNLQEIAREK